MNSNSVRPFRVLALDGGGMRGIYTAAVLNTLAARFGADRRVHGLDVGRGFDLIVGTSTGGILALGLAKGVSPKEILTIYRQHGPDIFPEPTPAGGARLLWWILAHLRKPAGRGAALREALDSVFGQDTLGAMFQRRGIALCIPCIDLTTQKAWIFKTPHRQNRTRDERARMVDVAMATAAAPIVLPLAAIESGVQHGAHRTFADGGLCANNPVLIGLIEALELVAPNQDLEILSVGTCAPPGGLTPLAEHTEKGFMFWLEGLRVVTSGLDAQSHLYNQMALFLAKHLKCKCEVVRLPISAPSPHQIPYLGLDQASDAAITELTALGEADGNSIHGEATRNPDSLVARIFQSMPVTETQT